MIFTEEHKALGNTVKAFVENELNPHTEEWETAGEFPIREVAKKMANLGLLGVNKPVEFGGLGLDYSYQMAFSEALGNGDTCGVGMSISVLTDMSTPALAAFGSDELRHQFLAPVINGDMISSIAVSEPGAGSDVAAIKTTARKKGDDYIINGTKMWITNAEQADFLCVLVNTDGDNPHLNKTLIVVPTNLPGISFSEPLNKLGQRASKTSQVFFDDVCVPQRYRIGQEGHGFVMQMKQFQEERLGGAATALQPLERCIALTADYTKERQAFGKPLLDNQYMHFRLAEMRTEVEMLRALVYQATEEYVSGIDVSLKASMAKLKAGRLSREITDGCLQFWGGMGFMWENPISRAYRDMRITSIGGGADEVMLGIIAKKLGYIGRK